MECTKENRRLDVFSSLLILARLPVRTEVWRMSVSSVSISVSWFFRVEDLSQSAQLSTFPSVFLSRDNF